MVLDISWGGAFTAGFLSFASPCVLPLVPPYLAFLSGMTIDEMTQDGATITAARKVFYRAFAFVLGFSVIFVGLGASASFFGSFITDHLETLGIIAGIIIIVLGLHFLGVFRIGFLYREARFQTKSKPIGLLGSFIAGMAFAFGWTPCVGPMLASILLYAGSEADVARGSALLFVYSLGIGIPFLLAALFIGPFMSFMKKFRGNMAVVEKIMGVLLVVTGILFLTDSMPKISYWMLETFPSLGTIG